VFCFGACSAAKNELCFMIRVAGSFRDTFLIYFHYQRALRKPSIQARWSQDLSNPSHQGYWTVSATCPLLLAYSFSQHLYLNHLSSRIRVISLSCTSAAVWLMSARLRYELWKSGAFVNYPPDTLVDVVARILALVPPWTRVYR
jgi:hypothetical protein